MPQAGASVSQFPIEATSFLSLCYIGAILGLYGKNGQENGNYHNILGLYRDHGTENGNYCSLFEVFTVRIRSVDVGGCRWGLSF